MNRTLGEILLQRYEQAPNGLASILVSANGSQREVRVKIERIASPWSAGVSSSFSLIVISDSLQLLTDELHTNVDRP